MGDASRFAARIQPRLVQTGQRGSGNLWRPRRIVLIRHGESAGNVDEKVYTSTPDWRIPLTELGVAQAKAAGATLREMMGPSPDANAYFYVSPYRRAKQTYDNIVAALEPSQLIGVREDPRITEQQFGNLQDKASMEQAKRDRLAFGRFYYRFAQGESALDVYARVSASPYVRTHTHGSACTYTHTRTHTAHTCGRAPPCVRVYGCLDTHVHVCVYGQMSSFMTTLFRDAPLRVQTVGRP